MHRGGGWNVERGRGGLEKADEGEGGRGVGSSLLTGLNSVQFF